MAKWFGKIGYGSSSENEPGVWDYEENIIEREYFGETIKNYNKKYRSSDKIVDDITTSTDISIIADPFAFENLVNIRYAEILGVKWKVEDIEVQHPRLKLTLGGLYNG